MKLIVDKWILSTIYSNNNNDDKSINATSTINNNNLETETHVNITSINREELQQQQQQQQLNEHEYNINYNNQYNFNQHQSLLVNANNIINDNTQYIHHKLNKHTPSSHIKINLNSIINNKKHQQQQINKQTVIPESMSLFNIPIIENNNKNKEDQLSMAINDWDYLLVLHSKFNNELNNSGSSTSSITNENENIYYLIDEFKQLSEYLINQIKLEELENQRLFSSRQQIIDFINKNLKIRLLKLTQLRQLFNEYESKFYLIETHQDIKTNFKCLSEKYLDMFDSIKLKLKCKITKFQDYLKNWTNFNTICNKLDDLFINSNDNLLDIKFHEKSSKINDNLFELKNEFGNLSPILDEQSYSKLQNIIVIYALKLKSFEENYELNNKKYIHNHKTKTSTPDSFDGLKETTPKRKNSSSIKMNLSQSEEFLNSVNYCDSCKQQNNSKNVNRNRSRLSLNELSTIQKRTSDKQVATYHDTSTQTETNLDKSLNDYFLLDTNRNDNLDKCKQNGKEYLLKTYLNNNEHSLRNNVMTSTVTTTTTTTRESGMDTFNEDDEDMDNNFKKQQQREKRLNKKLLNKKSNLNTSQPIKSQLVPNDCGKEFVKKRNVQKTLEPLINDDELSLDISINTSNSSSIMDICTKFTSILILFIICLLFLVLFMYFKYMFNPVCCDMRRDYLFINYT